MTTQTAVDLIGATLGPTGAAVQAGCQYRQQQERASRFIHQTLSSKQSGCLEGATGLGKSYAYLVAAAELIAAGKKVLLSTATINLQEQLVAKDIPAVERLTGVDLKAVLVKGRSNYVSLRRLKSAIANPSALSGQSAIEELEDIADLVYQGIGERGNLSKPPSDEVWTAISSDKDDCLGRKCKTFQQCYFYKARRAQYEANLIVVNHSLLCADLRMKADGKGVLPPYHYAIIDEAHEFPSTASTAFGERISSQQLKYLLRSVEKNALRYMTGTRRKETQGYLEAMYGLIDPTFEALHKEAENGLKKTRRTKLPDIIDDIADNVARIASQLGDVDASLAARMAQVKCEAAAKSLRKWERCDSDYVSFSERTKRNITLVCSPILVSGLLKDNLHSSVPTLMTSATLGTGNGMKFFMDEVGISGPQMQAGSPFDYQKNVKLYLPANMPEPNDPGYNSRLNAEIEQAIERSNGGNLVLFTSYRQMQEARDALEPWIASKGLRFLCQGQDISRKEIVETMRKYSDCVVFGTDSFWQGVDVPGPNLRSVVITKIPFRVPNHPVLKKRFEILEKQGLNPFFHYSLPEATMKFKQGFGRLIRSESDSGEVAILDGRVLSKAYGKQILSALPKCGT